MPLASNKELKDTSHWFLFMIFPFFAGAKAIQNFRMPWAKNVLWAFVVFYGFTFTIGKETAVSKTSEGGDINRYVAELKSLHAKPLDTKAAIRYFEESGEADIVRTLIAIMVSRFTDSQHVLTGVFGIIFGFFFTRNLWYLLERVQGRIKLFSIVLVASFFLLDAFWEINGFRFNTAVHIYLYGLLPYLFEGKKKYIWICFSAMLVHYTFVLPLLILGLYILLGNRPYIYFFFFVASIATKQINLAAFNRFIENNAPEAFVERSSNYRDTDKVAEFRGEKESDVEAVQKNWYAIWYIDFMQQSIILMLVFMFVMSLRKIKELKGLYSAFCFALLFFAISNLMSSLPSGGRFLTISCMLSATIIFFYSQNFSREMYVKNLLLLTLPAYLLFIIVAARVGFYSIGVFTVLGNPLLAIFADSNVALNDLIK